MEEIEIEKKRRKRRNGEGEERGRGDQEIRAVVRGVEREGEVYNKVGRKW